MGFPVKRDIEALRVISVPATVLLNQYRWLRLMRSGGVPLQQAIIYPDKL
ncbi:hypothetical protein QUA81_03300 [Microcoleus sp. F6_B4]